MQKSVFEVKDQGEDTKQAVQSQNLAEDLNFVLRSEIVPSDIANNLHNFAAMKCKVYTRTKFFHEIRF